MFSYDRLSQNVWDVMEVWKKKYFILQLSLDKIIPRKNVLEFSDANEILLFWSNFFYFSILSDFPQNGNGRREL